VLSAGGISQLLRSVLKPKDGVEGADIRGYLSGASTMPNRMKRITTVDKMRLGIITPQEHAARGGEMWALGYTQVESRREYFEELARNLARLRDWTDIALIISKYRREDLMFMQTCKLPVGFRRIVQLAAVVKTVREKWEKGEEIIRIIVESSDCSSHIADA
jgi:hypothetical protein